MATLEEIIEVAKTKESWCIGHKFNYGPIDYLYKQVVDNNANSKFGDYMKSLEVFEQNVHRVTDAETYFAWEHCKYDLVVRSDYLILDMRRAFPEVPFLTVCEWLRKHEGEQQTSTNIRHSLLPDDIAKQCEDLYSIPPTHILLRQ